MVGGKLWIKNVSQFQEKKQLGKTRHIWKDNNKMDLTELN